MNLSENQLKEIADELETGVKCYVHRQTGELVSFPDPNHFADFEEEIWKDEMEKIETAPDDYWEIEPMTSRESFQLMERFAEEVTAEPLRDRLLNALSHSKPFHHFKDEIDNSREYRQRWFKFRDQQTVEWVKHQLKIGD